ncbi:MAG TPA: PLP-dependent aminotransferase family protein, partial [Dongiaceae bacterium]|nr:PLP-dependent aminotransferase family protein [Dongiaceae bacterium]
REDGVARTPEGVPLPFQMGLPALDAFPRKLWSRLTARRARRLAPNDLACAEAAGHEPLRAAIAAHLAVARGIVCAPEQILITTGFQGALGLITRALMQPGDRSWIEDPCYFRARGGLAAAGAALIPVPVDAQGIDVSAGIARAPAARFALVTPSHQSPLGMTLSLPRRLALLGWAREAKGWIIEDDYNSEYHYKGPPPPALKSLDRDGRVLYVGTFSKVLFPALRLGYLVLPEGLLADFRRIVSRLHLAGSPLEQAVTADFMTEGHFARHIRRMRNLYAERRRALAEALADLLRGALRHRDAGGRHAPHRPARCAGERPRACRTRTRPRPRAEPALPLRHSARLRPRPAAGLHQCGRGRGTRPGRAAAPRADDKLIDPHPVVIRTYRRRLDARDAT